MNTPSPIRSVIQLPQDLMLGWRHMHNNCFSRLWGSYTHLFKKSKIKVQRVMINMGSFTDVSSLYHGGMGKIFLGKKEIILLQYHSWPLGWIDRSQEWLVATYPPLLIYLWSKIEEVIFFLSWLRSEGQTSNISTEGGQPHDIFFKLEWGEHQK